MNKTTVLQSIENIEIEVDYLISFMKDKGVDQILIDEKMSDIKGSIQEAKNQFSDFVDTVNQVEDEFEGIVKILSDSLA